jgi:hypothetical protein
VHPPDRSSRTLAGHTSRRAKSWRYPSSTEAYPFRDFTLHIRRLFDAYGPQRCYWGTDMTNGFGQGHLQAADHPFRRGAAVPIRAGQRLDHGPRHCRSPWLDLGRNRGPGFRFPRPVPNSIISHSANRRCGQFDTKGWERCGHHRTHSTWDDCSTSNPKRSMLPICSLPSRSHLPSRLTDWSDNENSHARELARSPCGRGLIGVPTKSKG